MSERDAETGRFLTGNSGGGRPKGSRNKLGEQFLEALAQDFAEHGQQAIVDCREEKPTEYVKVVAGLLPKELLVRKDPEKRLTRAQEAGRLGYPAGRSINSTPPTRSVPP